MIRSQNINGNGHLTHLIAEDLFIENAKQVFHAKTGKWLGTLKPGQQAQELNFDETPTQIPEPEIINPSQLNLF